MVSTKGQTVDLKRVFLFPDAYKALNHLGSQKMREMLGGTKGCTHLVELMGPVATAAYQTVFTARGGGKWRDPAPGPKKKPRFLDTCHALASDSEVVRRFWPDFYKGRDADKRDAS